MTQEWRTASFSISIKNTHKSTGTVPFFFFFFFLKVWWPYATLFFVFICLYTLDTFTHHSFIIHKLSLRPISISSQLSAQWVEPPWGAEPRFELGPALQQASALPTEPHCTVPLPPYIKQAAK